MLALAGIVVWFIVRALRRQKIRTAAMEYVSEQAPLLARKRSQLVQTDDYGLTNTKPWDKEKKYIISTVLPHHLATLGFSNGSISVLLRDADLLLARIEEAAISVGSAALLTDMRDVASGVDYERFCAEILRKAGWDARVTKGSGDQGADVIAEGFGRRIVVQCKFYTSPVGNSAVQEVVAARFHEKADAAIVVSNAPFTKSARQLSATTGAILLHHDQLPGLKGLLSQPDKQVAAAARK